MTAAAEAGRAEVRRPPILPVGTAVWLASELMFFGALFAAYFTLRSTHAEAWPPEGVELETATAAVFTALLVASSGTIQLGVRAIERGDRAGLRRWLTVTMLLAVAFLGNQAREWTAAHFDVSSHAFGSAFFVLTGFHGLHVLGGVLAMVVLLGRTLDHRFGASETPAVEVVSYYWHLVDVVWVGMFTTLFVVR